MSWNYRVLRQEYNGEPYYTIHEVYYRKNGSIRMWSEDAMDPGGSTPEELASDLSMMQEAFNKPILEEVTAGTRKKLREVLKEPIKGKKL
jgi:hypothetical protein